MGKHHARKDSRPVLALGGLAALAMIVTAPSCQHPAVPASAVGSERPVPHVAPTTVGGQVSVSPAAVTHRPRPTSTQRPRPVGPPSTPGRGLSRTRTATPAASPTPTRTAPAAKRTVTPAIASPKPTLSPFPTSPTPTPLCGDWSWHR
jgi:hypothetical protein